MAQCPNSRCVLLPAPLVPGVPTKNTSRIQHKRNVNHILFYDCPFAPGGLGTGAATARGLELLMGRICEGAPSRLEWTLLDDEYDVAVQRGVRFGIPSGRQRYIDKLIAAFPEEEAGIRDYFDLLHRQQQSAGLFFAGKVVDSLVPAAVGAVLHSAMSAAFWRGSDRTVEEVMFPLVSNPRLRDILSYCWGDYGMPPDKASFALHAMVVNHYLPGASYPTGGAGEIACRIIPTIEQSGGRCYVSAAVKHVKVDATTGAVAGVIMADRGSTLIRSECVISSVGALATFRRLVPEEHAHRVVSRSHITIQNTM